VVGSWKEVLVPPTLEEVLSHMKAHHIRAAAPVVDRDTAPTPWVLLQVSEVFPSTDPQPNPFHIFFDLIIFFYVF